MNTKDDVILHSLSGGSTQLQKRLACCSSCVAGNHHQAGLLRLACVPSPYRREGREKTHERAKERGKGVVRAGHFVSLALVLALQAGGLFFFLAFSFAVRCHHRCYHPCFVLVTSSLRGRKKGPQLSILSRAAKEGD